MPHIKITNHDGDIITEGQAAVDGKHIGLDGFAEFYVGVPGGEQRVTFRNIAAWLATSPRENDDQVYVYVTWTDDTDTNPRKTEPANVIHTSEVPLPGGLVGPFYVTVE